MCNDASTPAGVFIEQAAGIRARVLGTIEQRQSFV
jgi:hypothetical protein